MIGALALSAKRGECKDLGVALQRIFGVTCGLDTDRIFYEIFRKHPDWLRELTELPLPAGCRGSAMALKQLEIRCDLLLEPSAGEDPHFLVEFQLYHDHSVFNRAELARQLLWKQLNGREDCRRRQFRPRTVEVAVIFGSRTELPSCSDSYPGIRVLFLDELLEALEKRHPDSPLVAALAPLSDSLPELETMAAKHYGRIKNDSGLRLDDREMLVDVFLNLLLQRFKSKNWEEIRKMIAELTPLHETRAGRELLEEGIEKGLEKGIEKGRTEGELALTLRLLDRKFPRLAPALRQQVKALNEETLLAFSEALLFFENEEECAAWLKERSKAD